MERERKKKIIIASVLMIAVIGISIGFAAFSNNLKISASSDVEPLNTLKVLFSSSNIVQEEVASNIQVDLLPLDETASYPGFTASTPIMNNDDATAPTLSNLKANFVRPGESVTYTLYIHNLSNYDAQLESIAFGNKSCVAKAGTNQTLVDNACDEIDISVTVGGGVDEPTAVTKTQNTSSSNAVTNHVLAAGKYETVTITLSYANLSSTTGNTDINGDFNVTFGDVTLTYTSAN